MPLIMEPLSAFYSSPLVVLDFQSLYPSVMIAYNYCYSTCLGRVVDFKGQNKFGVSDLHRPPGLLGTVKDYINGLFLPHHRVERLLTDDDSIAQRDGVCEACGPQGVTGSHVDGATGYTSHGQDCYEGCQG